jgi:hypothetical protein
LVFGFVFVVQVYRYGEKNELLYIRNLAPLMPARLLRSQPLEAWPV